MRVSEQTKATFLILYFSPCGRIVGKHLSNAGELMSCEWRQEGRIAYSKSFGILLDSARGFGNWSGREPCKPSHFIIPVVLPGPAF